MINFVMQEGHLSKFCWMKTGILRKQRNSSSSKDSEVVQDCGESLEFHILRVISVSNNPYSSSYAIATKTFQNYVESSYKLSSLNNSENSFLTGFYNEISLNRFKENPYLYVLFLTLTLDIDLGPRNLKANEIAKDIPKVPPTTNRHFWKLLETVLCWLKKPLKNSLHLILQPLRNNIWNWFFQTDKNMTLAALMLTNIFLRKFPSSVNVNLLIRAILHPSDDVKLEGARVLRTAFSLAKSPYFASHFDSLLKSLSNTLNDRQSQISAIAIDAISSVLIQNPQYSSLIVFSEIPLSSFQSQKTLRLLPLAYRCTPSLFTVERNNGIFSIGSELLKTIPTNSSERNQLIFSLGEMAFLIGKKIYDDYPETITKLLKVISTSINSDQAVFAVLSLVNVNSPLFNQTIELISETELTPIILQAIINFCEKWPSHAGIMKNAILPRLFPLILEYDDPEESIRIFKALIELKLKNGEISQTLAVNASRALNHNNYHLRKQCAKFLLYHQENYPYLGIRLIAYLSIETLPSLRLMVLKGIKIIPQIITSLVTLINDKQASIRYETIEKLCLIPEGRQAIIEFVQDVFHRIGQSHNLDVHTSKSILIIVKHHPDIIRPFAQFLVKLLLDSQTKNATTSLLLAHLIPYCPQVVDVSKLQVLLLDALQINTTAKKNIAGLDLLTATLMHIDMHEFIPPLISSIHKLAGIKDDKKLRERLLYLITQIGAIRPKTMKTFIVNHGTNESNLRLLSSDSIQYSSVTIPLSITLEILGDESMSSLHLMAIESLLNILQDFPRVGSVMEDEILSKIKIVISCGTAPVVMRHFVSLINIYGEKIKPIMEPVVDVICENWGFMDYAPIVQTVQKMSTAIPKLFAPYCYKIASTFINTIQMLDKITVILVFDTFSRFNDNLSIVDYIVIPVMLDWISTHCTDTENCKHIINILVAMLPHISVQRLGPKIARSTLLFCQYNQALIEVSKPIVSFLLSTLREIFIPYLLDFNVLFEFEKDAEIMIIIKCILTGISTNARRYSSLKYDSYGSGGLRQNSATDEQPMTFDFPNKTPVLKEKEPCATWDATDWNHWLEETIPIFLNSSPSSAISSCFGLASLNFFVRSSLFPISFALCMTMDDQIQRVYAKVFESQSCPQNVVKLFLTITELLEVADQPILVPWELLAMKAKENGEYAQALRYFEFVFAKDSTASSNWSENLISLNQNLQLPLAASSILKCTKISDDCKKREELGQWNDALKAYEAKLVKNSNDKDSKEGKMRCLQALSRFQDLQQMCRRDNSVIAATTAWRLNSIDDFQAIVPNLPENNWIACFTKAILNVIQGNLLEAEKYVNMARENVCPNVFPFVANDYDQTFPLLCQVSVLYNLEQIIELKKLDSTKFIDSPVEKQAIIDKKQSTFNKWKTRFNQLTDSHIAMFDYIRILSLYLKEEDLRPYWISFLMKSERSQLTDLVLSKLDPNSTDVKFATAKLMHKEGKTQDAIGILNALTDEEPRVNKKLSKWLMETHRNIDALKPLNKYTSLMPDDANAWLLLSKLNFILFDKYTGSNYLSESLKAALNGLKLNITNSLPFTIRVISILFQHGTTQLYRYFVQQLPAIPSHVWVSLLPQIIARIGSENESMKNAAHLLITKISEAHPHAVIYSLLAPYQSELQGKHKVAQEMIEKLKTLYPALVKDALMLAKELIRIASSWYEQFKSGIDEASRIFVYDKDYKKSEDILRSLHVMTERPAETLLELSFNATFGQRLGVAQRELMEYTNTGNMMFFQTAWTHYYTMFQDIRTFLNNFYEIPLREASPNLAELTNTPLSVPGSYSYGNPIIQIASIAPQLRIMHSKQRPRKMSIRGTDGICYDFLLKPNEDTRLDERVMQLFDFISNAIMHSDIPMVNKLTITSYKVVPLTGKVGLIGWVSDCQTIYDFMKKYRQSKKLVMDRELNEIIKFEPHFEQVTELSAKLELFNRAIHSTPGDDLQKVMIEYATNSNDWLERRVTYTTSLASTSIVGYILGLGDRHLCNIMMMNRSGKLVHIDFGDCFEVAMRREAFPEKVPFRLTRVLQNALEITGIDGTFKTCCENVMKVLRDNGEDILGLLEAFIYDPLLQWKDDSQTAFAIIKRITDKLKGTDFNPNETLSVENQVGLLIASATNPENLCQMYKGWCPWW